MAKFVLGGWRRYRGWPRWSQVTIAVVAVLCVVGSLQPQRPPQGVSLEAAGRASVEESLPLASTSTTTAPTTTTTAATTTTTTAVPTTAVTAPARAQAAPSAPSPAPSAPAPTATVAAPAGCHPSYVGACLPVDAPDVDCLGGSGNGPVYAGRVGVVGPDVYDLDRDGDGVGCE